MKAESEGSSEKRAKGPRPIAAAVVLCQTIRAIRGMATEARSMALELTRLHKRLARMTIDRSGRIRSNEYQQEENIIDWQPARKINE
jgi:hypothetical protein